MKQELTIKIGGKKRLIKFGTNATAIYCDEYNLSLSGYNDSLSFDKITPGQLRDLIWSGLKAGALKKGDDDFTKYDVGDWIDELPQKDVDKIFALLNPDDEGEAKAGNP